VAATIWTIACIQRGFWFGGTNFPTGSSSGRVNTGAVADAVVAASAGAAAIDVTDLASSAGQPQRGHAWVRSLTISLHSTHWTNAIPALP